MIRPTLLEDGTVLRLVVDAPRANILTSEVLAALSDALSAHRDDPHLRLVLLRGAGGNFSFGASVEEHRRDRAAGMLARFHETIRRVASFPVPVACVVEGRCLGGAFELALASHFVFAKADAAFACPEIKLGVLPPVLAAIGAHRLPPAVVEHLLLTGAELELSTACASGFVLRVFDRDVDPEQATLQWYRETLRPLSAFSLRRATEASRVALLAALDDTLAELERAYVERLLPSHDGNEGIEAFLAKRQPVWVDA